MAVLNVFVLFAPQSPAPLGIALTKEALEAAYSHLPPGVTVAPARALQDADGQYYIVGDPLPLLSAEVLTAKKAKREQALAKLSAEDRAALGLNDAEESRSGRG